MLSPAKRPREISRLYGDFEEFLQVEKLFWNEYLAPKLQSNKPFYVITADVESGTGPLHHEIMHAIFASDKALQAAVKDFWMNSVSKADKVAIINELRYSYDVGSDNPEAPSFLLLTEFQAYVLQQNRDSSHPLEEISATYGAKLRSKLAEKGIKLPTVKLPGI